MQITERTENLCEILWNYLCMNQIIKQSDLILACGGHDSGVAFQAADLYRQNYAPLIAVSGGIVREVFGESEKALEADILGDLINKNGVPKENIIFERQSKNTGENLEFTEKLMLQKGLNFTSVIIVQKPYAERRTWCLAKKKWPNKTIWMSSEKMSRQEYFALDIPTDKIIGMMVGEIQRLIYSPSFGWIDDVEIPPEVLEAYNELCNLGFIERLMTKEIIESCMKGTQNNLSINAN